jgi:hypothetical protein
LLHKLSIVQGLQPSGTWFREEAERRYLHEMAGGQSSKLRTYLRANSTAQYGAKPYLSAVANVQLRSSLARFRCANHKLAIEVGRHAKPVKVPIELRQCRLCSLGAIEDEDHFLLVCPAYQHVRERFRGQLPLSPTTLLPELLGCQQQNAVARFIVQCLNTRTELSRQTVRWVPLARALV